MRITGVVRDTGGKCGGDGVVAGIRRGTSLSSSVTIWQRSISDGDATGQAFDVSSSVAQGTTLFFVVNKGWTNNYCDATLFDPKIALTSEGGSSPPPPPPSSGGIVFQSSTDFTTYAGRQSTVVVSDPNRWLYLDGHGDKLSDYSTSNPNCGAPCWAQSRSGAGQYLIVKANQQHPGSGTELTATGESIRAWVAPGSGTVRITGLVKDTDARCGDGVLVKIKQGDSNVVWQRSIVNGDSAGQSFDLTATVTSGQFIYFMVNKGSASANNYCDATLFDPKIVFTASRGASPPPSESGLQSILYNPGPTRICWHHQNNFTRPGVSDPIGLTSLKNYSQCIPANGGKFLWHIVTHAWSLARKGMWPGWDVGIQGGNGTPVEVKLVNHSAKPSPEEPDKCQVYETSFDWSYAGNSFKYHPSGRSYRLGDFTELHHIFQAKLDHFGSLPNPSTGKPWCPSFNSANVNADLVVTFTGCNPNAPGGGVARNTDIMSLWIYNATSFDPNKNSGDDIAFDACPTTVPTLNGTLCMKQFHANKLGKGIPVLIKSYQNYNIELLSIYKSKFPPPPGNCTLANAQINHIEVYSSARGHDLDISLKNLDVRAK